MPSTTELLHGDGEKFGSPKHVQKLREAIRLSRQELEPYRRNRRLAVQEYVGSNYSDGGAPDKMPINFLNLAVKTFSRTLAARYPRAMVSVEQFQFRKQAYELGLMTDKCMKEIKFLKTAQKFVADALFSIGIIKVGLASKVQEQIDEAEYEATEPYAAVVSLDDFVVDMTATSFEEAAFIGHRYRVPLEWAKNNKKFSEKMRKKLEAYDKREKQDANDADPVSDIGEDMRASQDPYIKRVELWEIYLPYEKKIVTMPHIPSKDEEFLQEQDYKGPEPGPYHILGYEDVPDNIMPVPPVAHWRDVSDLGNRLFRKLGRQAERQKTNYVFSGSAEDDAKRIKDAGDGDVIRVDNVNLHKEITTGGVDKGNMAFLVWLKDIFNYLAGNLDLQAGLGASAPTARQEQLIKDSGSVMIDEMKDRTMNAIRGVIEALAWYLWENPIADVDLTKHVPGFENRIFVKTKFTAEKKEGNFEDYHFDIEPYSMQPDTPQSRLAVLTQTWQQFIVPMIPMLEQKGIQVNIEAFLRNVARYSNMPEDLEGILIYADPTEPPTRADPDEIVAPKPGAGRAYERVTVPGGQPQSSGQQMMQQLLSSPEGGSGK